MAVNTALLASACFLFFAAYVNLNDPDAWLWSTSYGSAGLLCAVCALTAARNSVLHSAALAASLASFCLSAYSFSQLDGINTSGISGVFGVFEIEYVREGGGALLQLLAMLICARVTDDRAAKGSSSGLGSGVSVAAVLVASVAIGLGLYLPGYYRNLGVGIPEHCGGEGL
eukprot:TRINITY_DN3135_c0_g1_i1.p1 TRINITY_DN3135_c0_g1~~TRINITY_DN3135_c0_g1_i1.p1  ORF type:complete len:171 (-),score=27.75 TRINITY_DN3135_c0_g1_i1:127-639(-)